MTNEVARRQTSGAAAPSHDPLRLWLALGLIGLGLGAAAVSLLGPLAADVIRYHVSDGAGNQIVGGDVAGLALVAPVSVITGILVWRGHLAGPVLALGPAFYGLYMYSQLALGGDVARYPGNSERFFPLYLALFVLASGIAVRAWTVMDVAGLPRESRKVDRVFGWFALVVAAFLVVGLHLPGLVDAWRDQPIGTEYLADPVVFWLVKMMDLGVVVPALVAIGVGILRGSGWVGKAKYAAAGWIALLGSAVAGMAIAMQVTDDPAATAAGTIAFSLFALIGLVMAATLHRPLLTAAGGQESSFDIASPTTAEKSARERASHTRRPSRRGRRATDHMAG